MTKSNAMRIDDNGNYQNLARPATTPVTYSLEEEQTVNEFPGEFMSIEYVKIKIKSLADEQRIIRSAEHKQKKKYRRYLMRELIKSRNVGDKVHGWTIDGKDDEYAVLSRVLPIDGNPDDLGLMQRSVRLNMPNYSAPQYDETVNTFWGLRDHRTVDLRDESRAAQLAYAFMRGKTYSYVENATPVTFSPSFQRWYFEQHFVTKIVPRVAKIAAKYGKNKNVDIESIKKWVIESAPGGGGIGN